MSPSIIGFVGPDAAIFYADGEDAVGLIEIEPEGREIQSPPMVKAAPKSRRFRQGDRAARHIAFTALCAIGMVCTGGLWWLLSPEPAAESAAKPAPAFVLEHRTPAHAPTGQPATIAAGVTTAPSVVSGQSEPEELEVTAPAPATPAPARLNAPEPVAITPPAPIKPEPAAPARIEQTPQGPTFNGRPIRPVRTVRMLVTAYSPDERSCGKFADNITASGYSVWTNGMKLVAADPSLPFGAILTVPGYNGGRPVPVLDRGGKIKGNRLDVLYPTHETALQWGARNLDVVVWEYAD